MRFNAAWSMAVGGMIGGGIFSVLGVVTSVAGPLFPLSFVMGGLIALATAWSYAALARAMGEGGGAFTFLRHERLPRAAAALSWVLILGYTLTMAVYAFTFSAYLSEGLGLGRGLTSAVAIAIVATLVGINLAGVRQAAAVEIVSVYAKVLILLTLGIVGVVHWDVGALSRGVSTSGGLIGAVVGASAVFMAYEGFQLLTYDYDDIEDPDRNLTRVLLTAVGAVILVYVVVSLGAVMLTGAGTIVQHKEVALAIAGGRAAGSAGKWTVTVAAALSTASAINATLFATARLTRRVADAGELPRILGARNRRGMPHTAVILLGGIAAALAVLAGLSRLVEAASLTFLLTFAMVAAIAWKELPMGRWVSGAGALGSLGAACVLAVRMALNDPWTLAALAVVTASAVLLRPLVVRRSGSATS